MLLAGFFSLKRLMVVAAAFLLCLAADGWFAPSEAQASCGDYLMPHGAGGTLAEHSQDTLFGPQEPMPLPRPCHGPSCSRGSLPPASPVPPIPVLVDQWLCLLESFRPAANPRVARLIVSTAEYDFALISRLERPPR